MCRSPVGLGANRTRTGEVLEADSVIGRGTYSR
jgi:hypothetical protein